jgi:hypothetical protein
MKTIKHLLAIAFLCIAGLSVLAQPTGSVGLTWNPNSESDLAGYRVYQGDEPGKFNKQIDVGLSTVVEMGDLMPGRTYYWFVTAYNTQNLESLPSNVITVTTEGGEPVQAVTGWEMVRTATDVRMSWSLPEPSQGVGRWRVQWRIKGSPLPMREDYTDEPAFIFVASASAQYEVVISAEGLQGWGPGTTFEVPSMPVAPTELAIKGGKVSWTFGSR